MHRFRMADEEVEYDVDDEVDEENAYDADDEGWRAFYILTHLAVYTRLFPSRLELTIALYLLVYISIDNALFYSEVNHNNYCLNLASTFHNGQCIKSAATRFVLPIREKGLELVNVLAMSRAENWWAAVQ